MFSKTLQPRGLSRLIRLHVEEKAEGLRVQPSLDYKQRLRQLFFPASVSNAVSDTRHMRPRRAASVSLIAVKS